MQLQEVRVLEELLRMLRSKNTMHRRVQVREKQLDLLSD